MELFTSTESFVVDGVPMSGIPLVVDDAERPITIINQYIVHRTIYAGGWPSKSTLMNNARALLDYFSWLKAAKRSWLGRDGGDPKEIRKTISLYVAWSVNVHRKKSGEMLEASTINVRLSCINSFYRWVEHTKGLIPIGSVSEVHLHRTHSRDKYPATGSNTRVRRIRTLPRVLSIEECHLIICHPMPETLRLMILFMLTTGVRSAEVRSFPAELIRDLHGVRAERLIRIHLDPRRVDTKGGRERIIYLPGWLVQKLQAYVRRGERVSREKKSDLTPERSASAQLFLNARGRAWTAGALAAGISRIKLSLLDKGLVGEGSAIRKLSPHMFRHTYATMELHSRARQMDAGSVPDSASRALIWVRDRLGHSSLETTSQYLHLVDSAELEEYGAYQILLTEMSES